MIVSNLNYSAIVGCKAISFNCTVQHLKERTDVIFNKYDIGSPIQGFTVHMTPIKKCTIIVSNLIRSIAIDYKATEFNVAAL